MTNLTSVTSTQQQEEEQQQDNCIPSTSADAAAENDERITNTTISTTISKTISTTTNTTYPVLTIGIAGGTGAGKTTLARRIYEELGGDTNVSYLIHDSYYKDLSHLLLEERVETNFDHPSSLETSLLIHHIQLLKQGIAVDVPTYSFATHTRVPNQYKRIYPHKIIIIEGILILCQDDLLKEMDIKVFVEAESDIRLLRRLTRDIEERGRTMMDVIHQYEKTVRPMHEIYVEPSKQHADIIIRNHNINSMNIAIDILVSHLRTKINQQE